MRLVIGSGMRTAVAGGVVGGVVSFLIAPLIQPLLFDNFCAGFVDARRHRGWTAGCHRVSEPVAIVANNARRSVACASYRLIIDCRADARVHVRYHWKLPK
jgi:predicted HAD superfamily phosphohydrolase YqeG